MASDPKPIKSVPGACVDCTEDENVRVNPCATCDNQCTDSYRSNCIIFDGATFTCKGKVFSNLMNFNQYLLNLKYLICNSPSGDLVSLGVDNGNFTSGSPTPSYAYDAGLTTFYLTGLVNIISANVVDPSNLVINTTVIPLAYRPSIPLAFLICSNVGFKPVTITVRPTGYIYLSTCGQALAINDTFNLNGIKWNI